MLKNSSSHLLISCRNIFMRLIFVAVSVYENILTTKLSQITVYAQAVVYVYAVSCPWPVCRLSTWHLNSIFYFFYPFTGMNYNDRSVPSLFSVRSIYMKIILVNT